MLRKLLAVFLSIALLFSLCACGHETVQEQNGEENLIEQTDEKTEGEGEDVQDLPPGEETLGETETSDEDEKEDPKKDESGSGSENAAGPEVNTDSKLEYEGLEFGVRENGEDIICTIVDEASGMPCEITYDFENDVIVAIRAVYKCTEEYVEAIIETLKGDASVKPSSIVRSGNNVSCEMTEEEVADMAGISHSLLYSALKNAIAK